MKVKDLLKITGIVALIATAILMLFSLFGYLANINDKASLIIINQNRIEQKVDSIGIVLKENNSYIRQVYLDNDGKQ